MYLWYLTTCFWCTLKVVVAGEDRVSVRRTDAHIPGIFYNSVEELSFGRKRSTTCSATASDMECPGHPLGVAAIPIPTLPTGPFHDNTLSKFLRVGSNFHGSLKTDGS